MFIFKAHKAPRSASQESKLLKTIDTMNPRPNPSHDGVNKEFGHENMYYSKPIIATGGSICGRQGYDGHSKVQGK
jgi:hypothetical protein